MIIFVYGDSNHLIRRKIQELKKGFSSKFDPSNLNFDDFVYSESEAGTILQVCSTPPFLGTKRMVIVRDLLSTSNAKPFSQEWVEYLQNKAESTIVVLVERKKSAQIEKHKIFLALKDIDAAFTYPLDSISGIKLTEWVAHIVNDQGLVLSPIQLRQLIERSSHDMMTILLEIRKLAAFSNTEHITQEEFDHLLSPQVSDHIFELIDMIQAGNTKKALILLEKQRRFGTANMQLLAMLIRQIRILKKVKLYQEIQGTQMAKDLALHPFVVKKAVSAANKMRMQELDAILDSLLRFDAGVKTGIVSDRIAVDCLVSEFIQA